MQNKIVVITGAAGFIGYNLVKRMLAYTNYDLLLVESDQCKPVQMANLRDLRFNDRVQIKFVMEHDTTWPLHTIDQLLDNQWHQLSTLAGVVHLGAQCNTRAIESPRLWRQNIDLSLKIIEAARNYCPVLFASTAAIYSGAGYSNTPLHENMAIDESKLSPYAWTKFAVEKEAFRLTLQSNSRYPVTGLRFFNVYGEYEEHKGNMISFPGAVWNQCVETGKVTIYDPSELSSAPNARDFVHVQDCAELMIQLLDVDGGAAYRARPHAGCNYRTLNVGTGTAVELKDVAKRVADVYEKRTGFMAELEIKPMPASWYPTYQTYTCADTCLLQNVGVNFRSLEKGLKEFRAWGGSASRAKVEKS
jgi:ADP-L-glycero-D-manno-heptose 6-epimerase